MYAKIELKKILIQNTLPPKYKPSISLLNFANKTRIAFHSDKPDSL